MSVEENPDLSGNIEVLGLDWIVGRRRNNTNMPAR